MSENREPVTAPAEDLPKAGSGESASRAGAAPLPTPEAGGGASPPGGAPPRPTPGPGGGGPPDSVSDASAAEAPSARPQEGPATTAAAPDAVPGQPTDTAPPATGSAPPSGTEPAAPPESGAADATAGAPADVDALRQAVIDAIRTCYDPEIPVNIYEMGLVYEVEVTPEGEARIVMTLTSPMCPVAETLPFEVENKVREVPGIRDARVEVTWDPPWDPSMMSDAARLELGMM